ATGKPATSTSLAFIAALDCLNVGRVAVLATYPEPASNAFAAFLAEYGLNVASLHSLNAACGFDSANIDERQIGGAIEKVDLAKAEAVLIPDTALPSLDFVDHLESNCGLPVLTANQVTLWASLGLARRPIVTPGLGQIFTIPSPRDLK